MPKVLDSAQYERLRDALSQKLLAQHDSTVPFYVKYQTIFEDDVFSPDDESVIVIPRKHGIFDFVLLHHQMTDDGSRGAKSLLGHGGSAEVRFGTLYASNSAFSDAPVVIRTTTYQQTWADSTTLGQRATERCPALFPHCYFYAEKIFFSKNKPERTVLINALHGTSLRKMYFGLRTIEEKEALYAAIEEQLRALEAAGVFLPIGEFHADNILVVKKEALFEVRFCDIDLFRTAEDISNLAKPEQEKYPQGGVGSVHNYMEYLFHNLYENIVLVMDGEPHVTWKRYNKVRDLDNYLVRLSRRVSHPLPPIAQLVSLEALIRNTVFSFQFCELQQKSSAYLENLIAKAVDFCRDFQRDFSGFPLCHIVHENMTLYLKYSLVNVSFVYLPYYVTLLKQVFDVSLKGFFDHCFKKVNIQNLMAIKVFLDHQIMFFEQANIREGSKDIQALFSAYEKTWAPLLVATHQFDVLKELLDSATLFFKEPRCRLFHANVLLSLCQKNLAFDQVFDVETLLGLDQYFSKLRNNLTSLGTLEAVRCLGVMTVQASKSSTRLLEQTDFFERVESTEEAAARDRQEAGWMLV
jgi:hypothetical protein